MNFNESSGATEGDVTRRPIVTSSSPEPTTRLVTQELRWSSMATLTIRQSQSRSPAPMAMATNVQQRHLRQRVLNATDPTVLIIIPAASLFEFNGTSADLAQQFYQRYQAGDALQKLDLPQDKLPARVRERLTSHRLQFKNLHALLQRALLWDSGFVLDASARKLVKVYTANGASMADIAVSYEEFTGRAGCEASNCSAAAGAMYRSSEATCSGAKLVPVLRCASEDPSASGSTAAFWATGGGRRVIPELSIVSHTLKDTASSQTYIVNAIHSIAVASESPQENCAAVGGRAPSMVIPCARYADVSSNSKTTWAEPTPGRLVTVWLEHAQADHPGFSTTYTVLIVVAIIAGIALFITLGCKGKSRFKKRRLRKAEAKMTSADPQAFLDSSLDEALENSAVALTPVHAILESDLEYSSPGSASASEWHNAFVSHQAVAGKRLRMDQLVLKKLIAERQDATMAIETWAAKYHNLRVVVKKQTMRTKDEAVAMNPSQTPEFSAEIEVLASLRHRNIVRFFGVAWDSPDTLCIITEYARKGSLRDALRLTNSADSQSPTVLTWTQTQRIMSGVAKALEYLHTRPEPVVLGNMCAENVLLTSHFEPKLIGVGAARRQASRGGETQGASLTREGDIYALGALFAELIVFSDSHQKQATNAEEHKQEDTSCSQRLRDLVSQCLEVNPEARPTLDEVLLALM